MNKVLLALSYVTALVAVLVAIDITVEGSNMVWITLAFNILLVLATSLFYVYSKRCSVFFKALSWSFITSLAINLLIFIEPFINKYYGGDPQGGDLLLAVSVFFIQPTVIFITLMFFLIKRRFLANLPEGSP